MDAVTRAMDQIGIDAGIRALWTLHDDSRPADDRCFETLLDAWRNTPTAALLGAKQLDWQAKNLHNVGLYAGHHDVVSLVVDGEPDQEQYDGRQDVLSVSLSGALVPLATLRAFEGADPWFGTFAESTDLCRRICLGGGRVVVVPQARIAHRRARFEGIRSKNGRLWKTRTVASIRILPYARRMPNTRTLTCTVHGGRCFGCVHHPVVGIGRALLGAQTAVSCMLRAGDAVACAAASAGCLARPCAVTQAKQGHA